MKTYHTYSPRGQNNSFSTARSARGDSRTSEGRKSANVFAPPGVPGFAASQRAKILELLRQAGAAGVSKEDLIFRYRFTQAAARVFELERAGYVVRHESRAGERLVVFVLESEPLELSRPRAVVQKDSTTDDLPLFAAVDCEVR